MRSLVAGRLQAPIRACTTRAAFFNVSKASCALTSRSTPAFTPWLDWGFVGLSVAALAGLALTFQSAGYLPAPFYHAKGESFMDWYSTARWAHRGGAYSQWRAVYPPLAFEALRLITPARCYLAGAESARACDPSGVIVSAASLALDGALLVWTLNRKIGSAAWPRALALTLSASLLYALERGNLVLPVFALFLIAYGGRVRSPWAKAIAAGLAMNLKPYLAVAALAQLLQGDWRQPARAVAAALGIYILSWGLFGAGGPVVLARNAIAFLTSPSDPRYGVFQFTTTFDSLFIILGRAEPVRRLLGSMGIEVVTWALPAVMAATALGVTAVVGASLMRRGVLGFGQIAALLFSLVFEFSSPGAYALAFMLMFVMQESWTGLGRKLALLAAFLWCVPWDFALAPASQEWAYSYLSQRWVDVDLRVTTGLFLRPMLVLLMQAGLILASVEDFQRSRRPVLSER